eukprot:8960275-Pyramimonas_sp.AAC.2
MVRRDLGNNKPAKNQGIWGKRRAIPLLAARGAIAEAHIRALAHGAHLAPAVPHLPPTPVRREPPRSQRSFRVEAP